MDRPTVLRKLDELIVQFDDPFDNFGSAQRALKKALFWEDMHVTRSAIDGFWYVVDPTERRVYQIETYHWNKWQALEETGTASFPRHSDDLQSFLEDGHFQFLAEQDSVIA
jgi:hypothetical protein